MIPTLTKNDLIDQIETLVLENPQKIEELFDYFDFNKNSPVIVFEKGNSVQHAEFDNEEQVELFEEYLTAFFEENDAEVLIVINSLDDLKSL